MLKIALILSGCGFQDGSEIHEATLCLLALAEAGLEVECFAPDRDQAGVINHLTQAEMQEKRNILIESARIARGEIQPLKNLNPDAFAGILLPGGFGAVANLSDFATKGEACSVDPDLKKCILAFYAAKKPIGATCITPAVLAKIFEGTASVKLTLGSDPKNAQTLENMGMQGKLAKISECVIDEKNRIFTTPCYMEPDDLPKMYQAIKDLVHSMKKNL